MKARLFTRILIPFFYLIACSGKNQTGSLNDDNKKGSAVVTNTIVTDTLQAGKVIKQVFCKSNAVQSYALYIPSKGNKDALPVIYFFDPHGDGSFPLGKYKALADKYNFILIGSNNSKNGNDWPATESIWNTLFDDSQKRLKMNAGRIYTCGFSGGAKVAGYIALSHHEVKGVIANGAGLPDESGAANFNFSFTAITGEGDMNMTDLVAFSALLDKTQTRHRIIFFDGKHEWASENTMNTAFAGLQFDAMYGKLITEDDAFINSYITGSKNKIDSYFKVNDYVKAERECAISISFFDGLTSNVNGFKEKEASIKNNPVYQKQWQAQKNLLTSEQGMKALYMQKFQQEDMHYWSTTINDLQAKAKARTAEGAMYQRLLAYLSLAFYSISNQFVKGNGNTEAEYFVALYKMADATNSEAWYLSAVVNARNNNVKAAENDLLKSVSYGFADKNRMLQQPEFQTISAQINLTEISNKIK